MREIPMAYENGICYYLLIQEVLFEGQLLGESYGVKLISEAGEKEEVRSVTVNQRRAFELLDLLVRNGVTPITLWDVVQDWL